jgi:hypothetical protein
LEILFAGSHSLRNQYQVVGKYLLIITGAQVDIFPPKYQATKVFGTFAAALGRLCAVCNVFGI